VVSERSTLPSSARGHQSTVASIITPSNDGVISSARREAMSASPSLALDSILNSTPLTADSTASRSIVHLPARSSSPEGHYLRSPVLHFVMYDVT